MASHSPFADPESFSMSRHLTDTTIGPAEMYALTVVYAADSDMVDALCEHAEGSIRLLVGLYAAREQVTVWPHAVLSKNRQERERFLDQTGSCVFEHVRYATETDLLEGLDTARTVFSGGSTRPYYPAPVYVSDLFAAYAPVESLTDKVVAEMTVRFTHLLSPDCAFESRETACASNDGRRTDQFVSRFLLATFGVHGPSWDMFKHLHIPDASTGDIVALVTAVEQARWPALLTRAAE